MGVRRAVETAVKALSENPGKKVCSLGPLIHNSSVLNSLAEKGLSILDENNIENADENSVVIIRAHGVSPDVQQKLKNRGCQIIDATCPRVVASQKNVRKFSREGYDVFLAGDKNHGEVTSISGFAAKGAAASGAEGCVCVVQDSAEAEQLAVPEKAVLIAQTTFSPLEFEKIAQVLRQKNPSIILFNSICSATMERQNALRELAGCVDGMRVVGGCSSANTRRLFETAQSLCPAAALIETAAQIPAQFFGLARVGITAGASTPDSVIVAVEEALRSGAC